MTARPRSRDWWKIALGLAAVAVVVQFVVGWAVPLLHTWLHLAAMIGG